MGGLARTGNKEEKEEISQRFEGKKKACPESWSSFKDFKVDENFYCSIFGPWPILLTFLSTKCSKEGCWSWPRLWINSSQLVTRNLTLQQVVEFQPWIYYSLIRSRLERDSCSLERETCIELILNSICSRLGRVKGLWVHRMVVFSILRIDRRKVRKRSGVWSIDLRLLIKRY